jgi:ABC-type lipoprotein release transport system permease subunit
MEPFGRFGSIKRRPATRGQRMLGYRLVLAMHSLRRNVGLNAWLMAHYEMAHLPAHYVAIGTVVMLLLGQAAVLVPARRASNVPPMMATRSV